jgi:small GTP-binding protein
MKQSAASGIKIVIVGDSNVGKTSLLHYFVKGESLVDSRITTNVYLTTHIAEVRGKRQQLNLWDTAGEEKYRSLASVYLRSAKGILLVFDLTNRISFNSLDYWFRFIQSHLDLAPAIVVVGNKCDVESEVCIEEKMIKDACAAHNVKYFPTSAKTGKNVQKAFMELTEFVLDTAVASPVSPQIQLTHPEPKGRVCC